MQRTIKMSFLFIGLVFSLAFINFQVSLADSRDNSLQEFHYEILVNNIKYSGAYTGEIEAGRPSGEGIFSADDNSARQFIYEGTFEDGTFDGEGTITFADGNKLKCNFSSGLPNGYGEILFPDGSYTKIKFASGTPYGIASTYSEDSKLIDYDFYYSGESISNLRESASTVDYQMLFKETDAYYGDVLKINCTVANVFEDETQCIFRVEDEKGNIYWGTYDNLIYNKYYQAIMPTLKIGDSLELYAFFKGIASYKCVNDLEGSNYTYPQLVPITCLTEDFSFDRADPSYEYDEIIRFPYHYYNLKHKLIGTVNSVVHNGSNVYLKIEDKAGNEYYVSIAEEEIEDNNILILGHRVKVNGRYSGLYKEPRITTDISSVSYVLMKGLEISCLDN